MRVVIPSAVSLALAALGIWILVAYLCGDLWRWNQFRSAEEAGIQSVQSLDISGHSRSGSTSVTKLEVSWSYEVDGERFESSSVSIHKLRDDFDGFRGHLYDRLGSDAPGTCFYLEDRPEEAVLDRSLRPVTVMLSVLFSLVPLALAAFFGRAAWYELQTTN